MLVRAADSAFLSVPHFELHVYTTRQRRISERTNGTAKGVMPHRSPHSEKYLFRFWTLLDVVRLADG